jgi:SnoaL-like domain
VTKLEALDLVEIHALISTYVRAIDARDAELLRPLFATDAVLTVTVDPVNLGAPFHGRDAIVAGLISYLERAHMRASRRFVRHICGCPALEVADDGVCAVTAMVSVAHSFPEGGPAVSNVSRTGVYYDTIIREAGRWVFSRRELAWDPPVSDTPAASMPDRDCDRL